MAALTSTDTWRRVNEPPAMQAYANINVLVVATENITSEWYKGAASAKQSALACLPGMHTAARTQSLYRLGGWLHKQSSLQPGLHNAIARHMILVPHLTWPIACTCSRHGCSTVSALEHSGSQIHLTPIPVQATPGAC